MVWNVDSAPFENKRILGRLQLEVSSEGALVSINKAKTVPRNVIHPIVTKSFSQEASDDCVRLVAESSE
ncbi:hypothetical protein QQ045_028595 [Rhodiola kirilowii]